jgi:copper oxidase (laccase) domain-containing protein
MEEDVVARVLRAKTCAVSHHVRRIQATCGQGCMGTDMKERTNLTQAQRDQDMFMTRNKSTESAAKAQSNSWERLKQLHSKRNEENTELQNA